MALLALAGVYKIADPTSTSGALRAIGLPGSTQLVRLLGATEIGVGVIGIGWGGPIASAAAGILYGGFLVFVIEALRRKLPISSCGCLGATETPPTLAHVLVNIVAVSVLVVGTLYPIGTLGGVPQLDAPTAVAFILFTAAAVYLLQAVLTTLPMRQAASRAQTVGITPRVSRST